MSAGRVGLAVLPVPHDNDGAAQTRSTRLPWARFGPVDVVWSTKDDEYELLPPGGRRWAGGLALVTQVGRAFQDEHPTVRVLLDHGRQLVVDAATVPDRTESAGTCWRIGPLPANTVIVDQHRPAPARVDESVSALLDRIDPAHCVADIGFLAGLGSRHSLSTGFTAAANWALARLTQLGFQTQLRTITIGSAQSLNVVADRPGTGSPDNGVVIVTAHLDSINGPGGPAASAPGADDNASGTAGALELARLLADQHWRNDLRVVLFGGEEQGLFGSRQYVSSLPTSERARIRAALNMDMIGTRNTADLSVLLEGAPVSAALIDDLARSASTYTAVRVETSLNPFASDHVPFIDAGLPAVLTIEGTDSANANIHTAQDLPTHIEPELIRGILRMNLATLAHWLAPAIPAVPRPAGPVVARGPGRLDVVVQGAEGGLWHKSWDGANWQPGSTGYRNIGSAPG